MFKHVCKIPQVKRRITPGGFCKKCVVQDINWPKAWLLVYFRILHKVYPVNTSIPKYTDISAICSFCGDEDETLKHLFFDCEETKSVDLLLSSFCLVRNNQKKCLLYVFMSPSHSIENMINFFLSELSVTYFIMFLFIYKGKKNHTIERS